MAKKDKHFIPSPYKVVNEYEDEFIDEWKKNTKNMVVDVVKFLAQLIKDEEKQLKQ